MSPEVERQKERERDRDKIMALRERPRFFSGGLNCGDDSLRLGVC